MANPYLLLAGIAETTLSSMRNGSEIPVDKMEQVYALLQAMNELLAGGTPSIQAINTYAAGLNDAVQLRNAPRTILPANYQVANIFWAKAYGGAVGDGVTDDSAAIQKALAAAIAAGGMLGFEPAVYAYHSATPLTLTTALLGVWGFGATINGANGTSTDCFLFAAGNYAFASFYLPNCDNFTTGRGIAALPGASLINCTFGIIQNCKYGLSSESNATTSTLDNTWNFNTIAACGTAGIRMLCVSSSDVQQGHIFNGNFANGNIKNIYFNTTSGTSISPAVNTCVFQVQNLENGGAANSSGIVCDPNFVVAGVIFKCYGFMGGNTIADIGLSSGSNGNIFDISTSGGSAYSLYSIQGSGNAVRQTNPNAAPGSSIAAATSSNSRASFNSGTPVFANTIPLTFSIPSTSAGSYFDAYAYSPFTDGYTNNLRLEWTGSTVPPVVVACYDESVISPTVANQIHIRMLAVQNITGPLAVTANLHIMD